MEYAVSMAMLTERQHKVALGLVRNRGTDSQRRATLIRR